MTPRIGQVVDEYERGVPGATVYVYNQDKTLATITNDGTAPIAQPILTDEFGNYSYYANSGVYREDTWFGGKLRFREVVPVGLGASTSITVTAAAGNDVSSRVLLGSIASPGNLQKATLTEPGREGAFVFSTANLSAQVTADPQQGVYVAPSFDTTGASGAWVRQGATVKPSHFGATNDGATNDLLALQAFNDWFFASVRHDRYADFSGSYAINGTLFIGPVTVNTGQIYNCGGNLEIQQLGTGVLKTISMRSTLRSSTWFGSIKAVGTQTTTISQRTNVFGIVFEGNGNCRVTGGTRGYGFMYMGIYFPSGATSNDELTLGYVDALYCGSGSSIANASLSANWTTPVRSGLSRTTTQFDTITVDVLPDPAIETYFAVGSQPIFVKINGHWHFVTGWDRVAKTVKIYPWLYAADYNGGAGSGSLIYGFGAGLGTGGGDSFIKVDHFHCLNCGIGYSAANLYGLRSNSSDISDCGIAMVIGSSPFNAVLGNSLDRFYLESNDTDLLLNFPGGNSAAMSYITSTVAMDLSKTLMIASLDTATDKRLENVGAPPFSGLVVAQNGWVHQAYDGPNWNNNFATANFSDHATPRRVFSQKLDTQTINLTIVGQADEYHRLFGYRGSRWTYIGSGTNGAPTGAFTFVPPTKAYANCVTTNGSTTVTMPSTASIVAGMPITGTGIPGSTTVSSVTNSTTIVLSAAATASGTVALTVTGSVNGTFGNVVFSPPWSGPVEFQIFFTDNGYQLQWTVKVVSGQPGAPRIQLVTSAATVTPTTSNDAVHITAQAVALTLANPTGTPFSGQPMTIRIKDNGTGRAIAFGTAYRAVGPTLPTTTVAGKITYLTMEWNGTDSLWDVIAVAQQA